MWTCNTEVLVTDLGDELVLMHPARSEMFSLNESGRLVWQALPAALDDIAGALVNAYGITVAEAQADAQVVLDELLKRDLVRRS